MNWLQILTTLLPLVPGGNEASVLAPVVLELIQRIKSQSNMTTEQILARAGVTLDENKRMLLEDLERLQSQSSTGGSSAGGGSGSGGATGGGGSTTGGPSSGGGSSTGGGNN
ncbi:MAG TPA: hypothetical protein VF544_20535 [Pyrinomonadaceae bacterium]